MRNAMTYSYSRLGPSHPRHDPEGAGQGLQSPVLTHDLMGYSQKSTGFLCLHRAREGLEQLSNGPSNMRETAESRPQSPERLRPVSVRQPGSLSHHVSQRGLHNAKEYCCPVRYIQAD